MYWAAVTASTREQCQSLVSALLDAPQPVIPVRDRGRTTWTAVDGRTALVAWGTSPPGSVPEDGMPRCNGAVVCDTGVARVNPVYLARERRGWVVGNRASLLAVALDRAREIDSAFVASFTNFEFGIDAASPWDGIEVAPASVRISVGGGTVTTSPLAAPPADAVATPAAHLARALVDSVAPLRERTDAVVLSLTGGKDSRLIAATLKVAGVDFTTRTYGAPDHPDVLIAADIARELGVPHEVSTPPTRSADESRLLDVDIEARLRSTVLLTDGQLSAFENLGRTNASPSTQPQLGGHGGEILRGGYNRLIVGRRPHAALDFYRRLAYLRFGVLSNRLRLRYATSSSTRWLARIAANPLDALEAFFVVNRAGRWSAAARSVLLRRSPTVQPFFADAVIAAARRAPMRDRMEERLMRDVLRNLVPSLVDLPFADEKWAFETIAPTGPGPASSRRTAAAPRRRDWRTSYGTEVARYFRDYVLDDGRVFDFLDRARVERALSAQPQDARTAWCLATVTTLVNGDWARPSLSGRRFAVPLE